METILVSSNVDLYQKYFDIEKDPFKGQPARDQIQSKLQRRIKRRAKQEVKIEQRDMEQQLFMTYKQMYSNLRERSQSLENGGMNIRKNKKRQIAQQINTQSNDVLLNTQNLNQISNSQKNAQANYLQNVQVHTPQSNYFFNQNLVHLYIIQGDKEEKPQIYQQSRNDQAKTTSFTRKTSQYASAPQQKIIESKQRNKRQVNRNQTHKTSPHTKILNNLPNKPEIQREAIQNLNDIIFYDSSDEFEDEFQDDSSLNLSMKKKRKYFVDQNQALRESNQAFDDLTDKSYYRKQFIEEEWDNSKGNNNTSDLVNQRMTRDQNLDKSWERRELEKNYKISSQRIITQGTQKVNINKQGGIVRPHTNLQKRRTQKFVQEVINKNSSLNQLRNQRSILSRENNIQLSMESQKLFVKKNSCSPEKQYMRFDNRSSFNDKKFRKTQRSQESVSQFDVNSSSQGLVLGSDLHEIPENLKTNISKKWASPYKCQLYKQSSQGENYQSRAIPTKNFETNPKRKDDGLIDINGYPIQPQIRLDQSVRGISFRSSLFQKFQQNNLVTSLIKEFNERSNEKVRKFTKVINPDQVENFKMKLNSQSLGRIKPSRNNNVNQLKSDVQKQKPIQEIYEVKLKNI